MKQRVPVNQIMAKVLIAVPANKKLSEVNELFKEYNIRHIPVTEGTKLVGVVSKNDVSRLGYGVGDVDTNALNALYDTYELKDVMVKEPVTVSSETNIKDVAEILSQQSFHSLPVVDNNEVVGIVTSTDLVKYLLEQY
ncbi:CBS domain-containing protein [Empedobacter falsenii]|uniref:CBS domain-containing protein n=2 Tax=Empedobacter TaxID=59734 RepID=A0ABY8V504_9FLAO|nr:MULTISPECIES: CBS domain-containing protein [Empedobacter]MCA4775956.1 CBS domain-containing protein [Empedobacter stercoris]MCA4781199.1 CBS domain-containing protein [Empedobacter stercoris]MCA4809903.1 CBS domain-containing protein [Empedobacter stercoris]NOJ76000.1 CBS domain-containing protein [Empedobacter stercoris]QNT15071.1 CBS domain-containing protein [Empedobacter stercoris]